MKYITTSKDVALYAEIIKAENIAKSYERAHDAIRGQSSTGLSGSTSYAPLTLKEQREKEELYRNHTATMVAVNNLKSQIKDVDEYNEFREDYNNSEPSEGLIILGFGLLFFGVFLFPLLFSSLVIFYGLMVFGGVGILTFVSVNTSKAEKRFQKKWGI